MHWRFFRLNWSYAVGELFIVTIGVLIALAINEWNSGRLERAEEVLILERLLSDLQNDLSAYHLALDILQRKEDSLRSLHSSLTSEHAKPDDPMKFLKDVIDGATYGWTQHRGRRVTFDELLGSGKLGLIRSAAVRAAIGDYYELERGTADRIDERETAYPRISYQLVPRLNESEPDATLDALQSEVLAAGVFDSDLREYIIAEINFSRFVRARFTELRLACSTLVTALQTYLEAEH